MQREAILLKIINIIADTYGWEPEELSAQTSLIEDIDLKGNIEEFGLFVQRLNREFEIDLSLSDFRSTPDEDEEEESGLLTIADLVVMVEDAMLG